MSTALNLTIPLKQDDQTQENVRALVDSFTENYQKKIDAVLARSRIVHFARILVIDDKIDNKYKYLQVLTEFDGDPKDYTDFFRKELGPVFEKIFALAEDAPSWIELNNRDAFYEYTSKRNVKALGTSTVGNEGRGYLFSAVGDKTVRELQAALGWNGSAPDTGGAHAQP